MAESFGVSNERVALVPTILQAGYAAGLLFVVPAGDILRRRPMILSLILVTSLMVSMPNHLHEEDGAFAKTCPSGLA